MDPKRTSRRDLLKGAALAGGVTLGTSGKAPWPTTIRRPQAPERLSDDPRQQGVDRIRPALQVRDLGAHTAPPRRQAFTRRVREGVPRGFAAAGFCWRDHAIVAPLCGDDPRLLHAGHRSQAAHADDTRPGGSAPDPHHGRLEALPVSHPVALHRVCGKPAQRAAKGRAGDARDGQLRRMDRRAAFHAAQRVRHERQREMVRR